MASKKKEDFSIKRLEKETAKRIKASLDEKLKNVPKREKKKKKKITASQRTINKLMGRKATDNGGK